MESTCSAFVCPRQSISLSPLLSSLSKKVKTIVDELFLEVFYRHAESYVCSFLKLYYQSNLL